MNKSAVGKIIFHRPSQYANKFRAYKIFQNGKKIGEIRNNERVEFTSETGKQSFFVKIDWIKSEPINIEIKPNNNPFVSIELSKSNFTKKILLILPFFILVGLGQAIAGIIGGAIGAFLASIIYAQSICKPSLSLIENNT